jgi:hypothetical protein
MGGTGQATSIIDHRAHDRLPAQAVGQHQLGVDAVLPTDHIKAFFMETLDGRRDQRQDIGLDGDKYDVGFVFGQLINAGAGVADRLGQVFGPFDDDSPVFGRFEKLWDDIAKDDLMPPFGQKCGHDTAHGTGTDDGKGFGDKGLFGCHGRTSHYRNCLGRSSTTRRALPSLRAMNLGSTRFTSTLMPMLPRM